MFRYPVHASDYLDLSGYEGRGSVAGIVSDDNLIIIGYGSRFTYKQAKRVAEFLNEKRPEPTGELIDRVREIKTDRRKSNRSKGGQS
jgi:hypothetical protein